MVDRPLLLAVSLLLVGCPQRADQRQPDRAARALAPCPLEAPAPPVLPYEAPQHSLLQFWLTREPAPQRLLCPAARIEEHNRRMAGLVEDGWPVARWDLLQLRLEPARVRDRLRGRLERFRQGVEKGQRVLADGEPPRALLEELHRELDSLQPADEIRVALRSTPLRCFPTNLGVYEKAWDTAFDLMQCAQLRFGEPVRVAGKSGRFYHVWSTYSDGWVRPEDLSAAVGEEQARGYLRPAEFVVVQHDRLPIWADLDGGELLGAAGFGLRLPLLDRRGKRVAVQIPSPAGLATGWIVPAAEEQTAGVSVGYPRFTRAAFLDRAFSLLDAPYGWGGTGDKRDCSRLMMDLFAGFGVELPRNTKHQSLAGTRQRDVAALPEGQKALVIEAESRRGVVLLYMPGHVMLYLGKESDQHYAFHLFSGYLTRCASGGETMQRVNRTVVTSLELGRGGSRRAFIQRITKLIIFDGATPPASGETPSLLR